MEFGDNMTPFDYKAVAATFRNYDLEWSFIKEMDNLGEVNFPHAIVVIDCCPEMIGQNWILVYEAQNDNSVGVL